MDKKRLVIIGGGPAGLAAAVAAKQAGVNDLVIIERDRELGGILNQCIHNGFGLHRFKEELTGPEYAARFIHMVDELKIPYKKNTIVIDISDDKEITMVSKEEGVTVIQAEAIILAMGCRERPRGALNIPGYRPAGIYSAGTAQHMINIEGYQVGKEVVILGSGDIGLIMARRLTLEGANVKMVAELMPYSGGLKRNIVQCLNDYEIPLRLSHTVVDISGKERLTGVTLAKVDEKRRLVPGTEQYISCDTLLLSVGLVPENEVSRKSGIELDSRTNGPLVNDCLETSKEGVFACGNVLHVHDLVDYVSEEAELAGRNAANFLHHETQIRTKSKLEGLEEHHEIHNKGDYGITVHRQIPIQSQQGIRYTVPQSIEVANTKDLVTIRFRVKEVYENHYLSVYYDDTRVLHRRKKVLAPGEMEQIVLKRESFIEYPNLKKITVTTEVE